MAEAIGASPDGFVGEMAREGEATASDRPDRAATDGVWRFAERLVEHGAFRDPRPRSPAGFAPPGTGPIARTSSFPPEPRRP